MSQIRCRPFLAVAAVAVAIFTISLLGLPNLADNERRIANYVHDIVQNGNWLCQRDASGEIASKPPAYTWLATLASLPFEHLNRFTLYFPSALGALATALLLVAIGRTTFGPLAGLMAGLIYLLSPMGDKQMNMARYDSLFAFPVSLAAWCAFRAWTQQSSWTWFWLACAGATMVKGPLGIVLAGSGLLAALWERRSGNPLPLRGSHFAGLGLYVLICCGWLFAAWMQMGQPVIDKLIGRELLGHAVAANTGSHGFGFHKPFENFVVVFAPWSLIACIAFWRVLRRPSGDPDERRFERFLFCWFFTGLLVFSVAGHQRDRLIFPLVPAAALLAGRELAGWLSGWSLRRIYLGAAGVTAAALLGCWVYHQSLLGLNRDVQRTLAMRSMAGQLRRDWTNKPVRCIDSPFALAFYLKQQGMPATIEEAARALQGEETVLVAIRDRMTLSQLMAAERGNLREIIRWPASGEAYVTIVGNAPRVQSRLLGHRRADSLGDLPYGRTHLYPKNE